jgi:hypothetical protein
MTQYFQHDDVRAHQIAIARQGSLTRREAWDITVKLREDDYGGSDRVKLQEH